MLLPKEAMLGILKSSNIESTLSLDINILPTLPRSQEAGQTRFLYKLPRCV